MEYLKVILTSPAATALLSGLLVGTFTLMATRRQSKASRAIERHRFRYEIGRMTAEKRLAAYTDLAARVTSAYRAKTTTDWEKREWVKPLHEAKNFYYDRRFYFSHRLGRAFSSVAGGLGHDHPSKDILEKNLNEFFRVVRNDLLLSDLEESATRAVKAAVCTEPK